MNNHRKEGAKVMRKRLFGMLFMAVLIWGIFLPGTEVRAESIMTIPYFKGPDSNLDAPYDLKAVNSGGKVRLTWRNPSDNATDISIERKSSGHSFRKIASVGGKETRYTDDSIFLDTFYTYRVRALRGGQSSLPSNEVLVYTGNDEDDFGDRHYKRIHEDLIEIEAPANLRATVLSYSSISLTWDGGSSPIVGYRVERRSNNGSWVIVNNVGYRTRTFTDSELDRYTRYYYRVQAYNLLADSDYSDEISVCTWRYYDQSDHDRYSPYQYYVNNQPVVIKLQVGSSKYYVNQNLGSMDTAPFVSQGRTLVPIRFLAESIGANVDWNSYQRKATISHDGEVIELWAGRNTAQINGSRRYIDSANAQLTPVIDYGRIMLPLRFIAETLGFDVYWIDTSQEIILICS